MTNKLRPYINIGPGEFIKDELEFKGLTQQELSEIINISYQHLSDVINDKKQITTDLAQKLSLVFKQSAQYWLNLNNNYQLRLLEDNEANELIIKKNLIYASIPVSEMVKKKWLPRPKENPRLFIDTAMYILDRLPKDEDAQEPVLAFRKSEAHKHFNYNSAMVWYDAAKQCAAKYKTAKYSKDGLENLAADISKYTLKENGIELFIKKLSSIGVIFFVLPHLKKTYVDGASFYFGDNPVIVYTKRYDRIDNFWFTVAHEIGHILLHFDDKSELFLDDIDTICDDMRENEANNYATRILRLDEVIKYFDGLEKIQNRKIECAVNELGLHPSVISGALKFAGKIAYTRMSKQSFNLADVIPNSALADKYLAVF